MVKRGVTHKFVDSNFARPRLGIFAFRYHSNKNMPAPSPRSKKSQAVGIFCRGDPTENRTPI